MMYLRHRLTKICILRRISLVIGHVSHPYNRTDFTQALKTLILVSFRIDVDSHTFLNLEKQIRCLHKNSFLSMSGE
jgi:hypothetical protein